MFSGFRNGVVGFVLVLVIVFVVGLLSIRETVYCVVSQASEEAANGYYSAVNGIYWKHGSSFSYFRPEIFDVISMHRDVSSQMTMSLTKHMWMLARGSDALYVNSPSAQEANKYIDNPPFYGWGWGDDVEKTPANEKAPIVDFCIGSLQDSPTYSAPSSQSGGGGGLNDVLQSPATFLLLVGISVYDLYLWAYRIGSDKVAYSYDAVVNRGEYWRMITASIAHFEPLHWLFNTISLYQLGFIESVYGSAVYTYLSLDLIFLTMCICVFMDHVLIYRYNRPDVATRLAVGYSCVLFAWMVAASVRMNHFCPIFLLPNFCFNTYQLPLIGLPVNLGPLILLVVTKIIIPQSSFLGHLSGIVIGYPLAWNMLDWLTPPLFFAAAAVLYICVRGLLPWRYPGFEQVSAPLAEFIPAAALAWMHRLQACTWLYVLLVIFATIVYGPIAALPRLVLAFASWSALQSRRCSYITEMHNVVEDTTLHLVVLIGLAAGLALCDAATCGVYCTSWAFITAYAPDPHNNTGTVLALALASVCLLVELLLCVVALHLAWDLPQASALLGSAGLGPGTFGFAFNVYHQISAAATGPFAGRGRRLDGAANQLAAADEAFVEITPMHSSATAPPKTIQL